MRKFIKTYKLFESPDSVIINKNLGWQDKIRGKGYLSWEDRDCISFGYYNNDKMSVIDKEYIKGDIFVGSKSVTHSEMVEEYTGQYLSYNDENPRTHLKYAGRLWMNSKVISFWDYPDNYIELRKVLDDIEKELNRKEQINLIIDDSWLIEVIMVDGDQIINKYKYWGDSEISGDGRYIDNSILIPISNYKGSSKRSDDELAMKHLKVGAGGKDVPQGFGSKNNKKKPIEWKHALGKFRGESVQFTYNKELSPKFWNNYMFDERLREKLITISNEFYSELEYESPIIDIVLVGSLCNFNYNMFSDLDVHIIIDFKKINKNTDLVKKSVDSERFAWNLRHNIRIKGHDVELYIQDISEENISGGIYSLKDAKWISKPLYNQPEIEEDLINFKFLTYKSGIEKLEEISNREMSPEVAMKNHLYVSEYKKKIKNERQDDLAEGGEFSVGNLVFKKLRNSGDYGKLIDIKTRLYDKIY